MIYLTTFVDSILSNWFMILHNWMLFWESVRECFSLVSLSWRTVIASSSVWPFQFLSHPPPFRKPKKTLRLPVGSQIKNSGMKRAQPADLCSSQRFPSQMSGIIAGGHVQLPFSRWSAQLPPRHLLYFPPQSPLWRQAACGVAARRNRQRQRRGVAWWEEGAFI